MLSGTILAKQCLSSSNTPGSPCSRSLQTSPSLSSCLSSSPSSFQNLRSCLSGASSGQILQHRGHRRSRRRHHTASCPCCQVSLRTTMLIYQNFCARGGKVVSFEMGPPFQMLDINKRYLPNIIACCYYFHQCIWVSHHLSISQVKPAP